jgi:hypothetical protein
MNLQQMIDRLNTNVDDVVDPSDATGWFNEGKDKMAIAVEATFPDLDSTNLNGAFVFPAKWHSLPVLYASAMYKKQDTALSEANDYMAQFFDGLKDFVKSYEIPPRYRDDRLSQQFTATAGQTTFTITKLGYDPVYGDVKVYVNDRIVDFTQGDPTTAPNDIILTTAALLNDAVTMIWEEHVDLLEPPYNWQKNW